MKHDTTQAPTLLVVDDEPSIFNVIERFASACGFTTVYSPGGLEALDYIAEHRVDVAAVDLQMPQLGGLDVLRAIRAADADCQVILMSGAGTIDSAIEAVRLGAIDFLTKPIDFARFRRLLGAVRDQRERRRLLLEAEQQAACRAEFCGMIGRAPAMQQLFALIERLAPHIRTALITGETGTGKELVARALVRSGPRHDKPFVTINCSAVVETLFESELFGHVRGAFTGATNDKAGLFESADGGTLFLDEIGELPLALQAKLLRVLESGEVQRVGSIHGRQVDVHLLAATNRDLLAEVDAGRFRADLFYRLNVVELRVPPLRDRRTDIPYLTAALVRQTAERIAKPVAGLTPAAEQALAEGDWPGNVRELRNVIERACILADGEFITDRELTGMAGVLTSSDHDAASVEPEDVTLSALERQRIVNILERVKGNKSAAARLLGLTRWTLYRRMKLYDIVDSEATP
jgi:two-component system, NtrC family, response regulator HydG